jgi:hypothetical protein
LQKQYYGTLTNLIKEQIPTQKGGGKEKKKNQHPTKKELPKMQMHQLEPQKKAT